MRTTLTLDDDVASKLQEFARRKKLSFKEAVNTILRRGFVSPPRREGEREVRVPLFDSPFRAGVDPVRLNQLSDDLDVERLSGKTK